jgi:tRNA(adenine34) deaminase
MPLPPSFHESFMRLALQEAAKAAEAEEVPTGCVIIERPKDEEHPPMPACVRVLGRAHNQTEMLHDPTAHAEMIAITQACSAVGDFRLADTILYVTKEPCAMCAGAIVLARVPLVVYGVGDPRRGGQSVFGILDSPALIHRAQIVGGVLDDECRGVLQDFFRERRKGNE